ncbi:hypothetical protein [Paeniglutamicibacter sp. Y32M11]|uniref:hypothetical protein n=1 Tax=Paeniglutamicibacter sp. Y32M11 TaxID=2853258 RepID=UPI001C52CBAB|nr:hypothetical protein [Paeniglutamicibacter sp. Y32M11]QXQ09617.1 hypothetical protein KUF55_14270 [Paeniglutamicibacter sp. Y32M11]
MSAPIGNTGPTSGTGNPFVIKRGPGDYVMFIEAGWTGTTNGLTKFMWQTWVAIGTSPLGPFVKVREDALQSLRPFGIGMGGGPYVVRENDQWLMLFHGTGTHQTVMPTDGYRAVNNGNLTDDTWEILDINRSFIRRSRPSEVDQVADLHGCEGPDGAKYIFYSGNQNGNSDAAAGVFNVMATRTRPAVLRTASGGRLEQVPTDGQKPVSAQPTIVWTDLPQLNPAGTLSTGPWGVEVQPAALGGVVRTNYVGQEGDYIAFQNRLVTGKYAFRILTEHGPDMGRLAFRVRGGTIRDGVIFTEVADLYAPTKSYNNAHEFRFELLGDYDGLVWIQLQVATETNAGSTGYRIADQGWRMYRLDMVEAAFDPLRRPGVSSVVTDSFDRADTANTPGASWVQYYDPDGSPSTRFRIASNMMTLTAGSSSADQCVWGTDLGSPDFRVRTWIDLGSSTSAGIIVRWVDYRNFIGVRFNATGQGLLYRVVDGATAAIQSAEAALTTPSEVTVTVAGNTATVYVGTTQIISNTLGTLPAAMNTAQKVGLRANSAGATPPRFNNFLATPA